MDVNSLEGVKYHVVIASIANTAPMTHNIPNFAIAAATRHPTARRAQPAASLTITHKSKNGEKAAILLIQLSIINRSMV